MDQELVIMAKIDVLARVRADISRRIIDLELELVALKTPGRATLASNSGEKIKRGPTGHSFGWIEPTNG